MAVPKMHEWSDLLKDFDTISLIRYPRSERIVEAELSTGNIQRIVFILVDRDFEDDMFSFRAVALVAIRFSENDPSQNLSSAWLFKQKRIQLGSLHIEYQSLEK